MVELRRALLKLRVWHSLRRLTSVTGAGYCREVYYQNLVHYNLRALNLPRFPLFPVKAASNYSLLHLLLRLISETDCNAVLEVGAGQTSLLLNALKALKPELSVLTLEADADWAQRIGQMVDHKVAYLPLVKRQINGIEVEAFSDLSPLSGRKFDLVLIDGPVGSKRHSRWANLEVLSENLADDFVVVFDDAERVGEQDTIKEFMKNRVGNVGFFVTISSKCQFVAFTPRFSHVRFL